MESKASLLWRSRNATKMLWASWSERRQIITSRVCGKRMSKYAHASKTAFAYKYVINPWYMVNSATPQSCFSHTFFNRSSLLIQKLPIKRLLSLARVLFSSILRPRNYDLQTFKGVKDIHRMKRRMIRNSQDNHSSNNNNHFICTRRNFSYGARNENIPLIVFSILFSCLESKTIHSCHL